MIFSIEFLSKNSYFISVSFINFNFCIVFLIESRMNLFKDKKQISKIEKKVEKLKIYSVLEDKDKDSQIIKNNDFITLIRLKENQKLYHCSWKIQSTFFEVFNFELYGFKSENFLYKMLIEENRTFYMKIDFIK